MPQPGWIFPAQICRMRTFKLFFLPGLLLASQLSVAVRADDPVPPLPLHERIDQLVERGKPAVPPATDAEFLRRVWLDLVGVVPTSEEARAFLDDPSPYKRARLIDRLLESPSYARNMAIVFDTILMERRPDTNITTPLWHEFLRQSFASNVPYDTLVRTILGSDGRETTSRPAAKFYLDRAGDPNVVVRDVGRIFLGRDMQCAQCHDHPLIDDYKQADYYGLYAFVSRSYVAKDGRGQTVLGEKADGDVSYASVFKKKEMHKTGPKLLDGPEVADPEVAKGSEYWVFPAENLAAIPRVSRRTELPGRLASSDRPEFARTIANRLWAHLFGRGIVHPVDLSHESNPPSNPELLDLLANEMVSLRFDLKAYLRELALTRIYQRTSEPLPGSPSTVDQADPFRIARLKPMTPEQIGWSVMQATGVLALYNANAQHDLFATDPRLKTIVEASPRRDQMRAEMVEALVYSRLNGSVGPFLSQFAGAPGQLQDAGQATVHQALFFANGEPVQSWLNPSGKNLTGRLGEIKDAGPLAEELYLTVLARRPTVEERKDVEEYLKSREADRPAAIRELAWALLASTEFRFNH